MKRFGYRNATAIAEAVALLQAGNAAVLGGGTDILNLLKMGALKNPPEVLVNIKNIPALNFIREDREGVRIGATTKVSEIAASEIIRSKYPALARAAGSVASPPIREMATIAGNLCQQVQCWYFRRSFLTGNTFDCARKGGTQCYAVDGDNRYHAILGAKRCFAVCPSDIAVALAALDTAIVTSKRSVPLAGFFQVFGNVLDRDEIITELRLPTPDPRSHHIFLKYALRPTIDFAVASVAASVTTELGKVLDARIVLGAVAPVPFRATRAEEALKGNAINEPVAELAAAAAVEDAIPLSGNKYKVAIVRALVKRAILA
jgi:xanthine dehydrogenase YagS FAD-binding subunit